MEFSLFLIPVSLQPDSINLWYFKLRSLIRKSEFLTKNYFLYFSKLQTKTGLNDILFIFSDVYLLGLTGNAEMRIEWVKRKNLGIF